MGEIKPSDALVMVSPPAPPTFQRGPTARGGLSRRSPAMALRAEPPSPGAAPPLLRWLTLSGVCVWSMDAAIAVADDDDDGDGDGELAASIIIVR